MQCLNATRDLLIQFALPKREAFQFSKQSDSMNNLLRQFFLDIRSVG
jgi:hypothetical protein